MVIFRSYVSLPEGKPNAISGSAEDDMVFFPVENLLLGESTGNMICCGSLNKSKHNNHNMGLAMFHPLPTGVCNSE